MRVAEPRSGRGNRKVTKAGPERRSRKEELSAKSPNMNKHECENLGPRGNQIRQRRGAGEGHLHAHSLRWSWGAVSLRSEPKAPEALLRGVVIVSPTVVKPTFTISKRLNLQQTGTFCLEIVRPAWLWHGCLCYSISLFADGSKL